MYKALERKESWLDTTPSAKAALYSVNGHPVTGISTSSFRNASAWIFHRYRWIILTGMIMFLCGKNYIENGQLVDWTFLNWAFGQFWIGLAAATIMSCVLLAGASILPGVSSVYLLHGITTASMLVVALFTSFYFELPAGTATFVAAEFLARFFKWHSRCMSTIKRRGDPKYHDTAPTFSENLLSVIHPTLIYDRHPPSGPVEWLRALRDLVCLISVYTATYLLDSRYIFPYLSRPFEVDHFLRLILPCAFSFSLHKYALWYCYCGGIARLTGYGFRDSYTVENFLTLSSYFREWSLPVHHFLTRHAYLDGEVLIRTKRLIANPRLIRPACVLLTFIASAVFHEVFVFIVLRRVFMPVITGILLGAGPFVALEAAGLSHPILPLLYDPVGFLGKAGFFLGIAKGCAGM